MNTELSVHVSVSSEAEVPAIGRSEQLKLWLHSQRAYIFISVLVSVTWYLTRGNLKEGRSIVAHGWRGRSMMDTPIITMGTHLAACYVYICLNQEVKRRLEAKSWQCYINLKAYPQVSHLFQLGPHVPKTTQPLERAPPAEDQLSDNEPVGNISYPTPQIRACVLVARLHSPAPALWILRRKQTHYKISSNVLKVQCDEHAFVQMCTRLGLSNAESRLSLIISRKHLFYLKPESL